MLVAIVPEHEGCECGGRCDTIAFRVEHATTAAHTTRTAQDAHTEYEHGDSRKTADFFHVKPPMSTPKYNTKMAFCQGLLAYNRRILGVLAV